MDTSRLRIEGRFWLQRDEQPFLGRGRVELLERIDSCGSIAEAARLMGMGYKTAWDNVDAINNLAEQPLVERQKGGKHGGGTRLTAYGKEVIALYRELESAHSRLLDGLVERYPAAAGVQALLGRLGIVASARNQLLTRICSIEQEGSVARIELDLGGDDRLYAELLPSSVQRLALQNGSWVIALIKATALRLCGAAEAAPPVGNRFVARIERIGDEGEVVVKLGGGRMLHAVMPSGTPSWLAEGAQVRIMVEPTDVILLTTDIPVPRTAAVQDT